MRGSLGEKIGEGAVADIHAWAPGQVVKLLRAGISWERGDYEARMTRAVFAAGVPAPEVLDEVTLDGRFGIVMSRLDGPTLLQLLRSGAMTSEQAGAILASLYRCVHETPPPPGMISLHYLIASAARLMPRHIAFGILALIERLPPGDGLCHLDLHPSNVIMTAQGPRIIDWAFPVRAAAAADLARCHTALFDLVYAPEDLDPARPHALHAAVHSEYARLAGMSSVALTAAIEPYLPILRAFALADGMTNPARRERLTQHVEAALRSALGSTP
ncbi:MAG: aminoglycoside phosphotransferase family protein [Proteobacteria bacterium]|nr:aminoglycoside phosphotransferase family protein [Pseudomonadota bacterium]